MGAGVATVGRRPYAVGLYWENSPSGRVSQTAKEAARQPGQQAEFYAVRAGSKSGRIPQFGLSPTEAGHKIGMPVFAACLANQQPGSWAGAFRLREGTVVTVVRDELIVPDGDQFFADESEARDRLLQEIGFGGLQKIYAPETWAIPGADTMPVSLLLNERSDVKLKPIRIPKSYIAGGLIGVLLLLLVLGIAWYIQAENTRQEAEQAAKQAEIERLAKVAKDKLPGMLQQQQPQYPPPDRKWEKRPLPMDVIKSCHEGLARVPGAVAGWRMTEVKCDGTSISSVWSRDKGFSALPKDFVVNDQGIGASFVVSLPTLEPRGSQELVDPAQVTRLYLGQNWPGTINRIPDDPPPPPPPGYTGEWNPPPPEWVKRSFTVTVPVLPWNLSTFLGDLPGTIIDSMKTSGAGWIIEGVIYEKRK